VAAGKAKLTRGRILVRLEGAPPARAAMEAAAGIAARLEAELVGLFVEDIELLHWAGLPFTREVGLASARSRPLDVKAMERTLRSLANESREALAEIAARTPLRWSFRVARGSLPELLAAAAEADLLVARAGGVRLRPPHVPAAPILLVQERGSAAPRFVAVCTATTRPEELALSLNDLVRSSAEPVEIMLLCEDAVLAAQWQRKTRAVLADAGPHKLRIAVAKDHAELRRLLKAAR
jgi:hypothetical protein